MIDSVLKGTGNSRFLKSAVPAGTSWADALAMLQAGTFPIDFNGINTEGFQQVGTPLNKANLLKDATAAQIGLPPSTTPDGMFQALGNTGELHVWRKTVKTSSDTPAGYTLEAAQSNLHVPTSGQTVDFVYSASITVGNDGTVSQPSSGTKSAFATSAHVSGVQSVLAGKFFTVKNDYGSVIDGVWYCPPSLTVSVSGNDIILSQAQKVNAHGIIPAGTTTTYPVSTNPNAYQEGDDAKPAGYTLGETVTGKFRVSSSYVHGTAYWKYGTSLTVSDDGAVNIANPLSVSLSGSSSSVASDAQQMAGKYAVCTSVSDSGYEPDFPIGTVVFFPSDTSFTRSESSCWASKYQPVTGYAAIPAGTTIEYLGKLGDKARVQVVSYVGTGTYGDGNQCSITANFKIKSAIMMYHYMPSAGSIFMIPDELSTDYTSDIGFSEVNANYSWAKKSADGKTLFWYGTRSASGQFNESGRTYYVLCIG